MQDLRLVGVHEDGQHLLLAGDDGARFRLPLDETLRAAARRDRPRLGQLQIELDGGLRPREVQALIRAGLSAEEVADRAGWSVDKVRRYEGPVLAEREHVAELARAVRMRGHGRGTDEPLSTRVAHRLTGRGVDPASASWDAARDPEGRWSVLVLFSAGGRERTATWQFDVPARTVTARDDEARWLSEDDADQSGPIPSPHQPTPSSAPTTVYDVESDGGLSGAARARRRPQEPIDLMAAMRESSRSRRPRRRVHQPTLTPVDDEPREDALPLEPVRLQTAGDQVPPPARGAHPLDEPPTAGAEGASARATAATTATAATADEDELPDDELLAEAASEGPTSGEVESPHAEDAAPGDVAPDPNASQPEPSAAEPEPSAAEPEPSAAEPEPSGDLPTQAAASISRPRRGGRPSVPRWDDIMFGAKGSAAGRAED